MKQLDLEDYEREELIHLVKEIIARLDKKKTQLHMTQTRLRMMRSRFKKTQAIVKYQGERITQLYEAKKNVDLYRAVPSSKTITP
jgi:hypothetical protein